MPFDPLDELQQHLRYIEAEIIDQYLAQDGGMPWVVAFSGGKDSTMLLQLVWLSLLRIPVERRTRPVHIISNNTLVENPVVLKYTLETLEKIRAAVAVSGLPITLDVTQPKTEDSFWVKLIGLGYPAPNRVFRWCTDRMKIRPTTALIQEKINAGGGAVILLGTRKAESQNRKRSMEKHAMSGRRLKKHTLPMAYTFTPIEDITTEQVWQYLSAIPAPWGPHHRLITLYKNASDGDCPLVTDISTPSCGQSRFGCWVCTVVSKDKSIEAMIDNGEEWLEPLNTFRDLLAASRDDLSVRLPQRRDGTDAPGPYTLAFRQHLLDTLLEVQSQVQKTDASLYLITLTELLEIRAIWRTEQGYTVAAHTIRPDELAMLREVATNESDVQLLLNLLDVERNYLLKVRKRGLLTDLETVLHNHLKTPIA